MVMVHKFQDRPQPLPPAAAKALAGLKGRGVAEATSSYEALPSSRTFGVVNASDRIVMMVDEAHRTQGSELAENLFDAFPHAARIAFTGTPLITEAHGERRTARRFGDYIDKYKLMDAVNDGATLQILYEGRTAEVALEDREGFDTKFEDLFRERTPEEILAIKKKYGAAGDLMEAEGRIGAIARDLVDHYVRNILPDGFKAQVVCHSKLAAVRYQKALREALAERVARERVAASPDAGLLRRLEFLKVAVVISSEATNEPAMFTEVRREARRWDAVENFCRPMDLDDPDKALTGVAFLLVCDMLLTGFDAPVEQVMYIDKRLHEHTLLQAIARVNRVAKNKHRGFIVDYIGLANHLKEALAIYASVEAADLDAGFKDVATEVPILEERYQRLLQHFRGAGVRAIEGFVQGTLASPEAEVAALHAAVESLEDIKRRADFEVYLKKFLHSLNLVLPNPAGRPYRGAARRFGYLLRMTKERYKDDTLDVSDAGEKVKALIDEHLVERGIHPKIPPVELLSDDFLARVEEHGQGSARARASEMEHSLRKHCTVHFDEDPAFYRRMSEKLERLIEEHRSNWDALADGYARLRQEVLAGRDGGVEGLSRAAVPFYEHMASLVYEGGEIPEGDRAALKAVTERVVTLLRGAIGVLDFWKKPVAVKKLRGDIDTELLLADVAALGDRHERVAVELVKLAEKRHGDLVR